MLYPLSYRCSCHREDSNLCQRPSQNRVPSVGRWRKSRGGGSRTQRSFALNDRTCRALTAASHRLTRGTAEKKHRSGGTCTFHPHFSPSERASVEALRYEELPRWSQPMESNHRARGDEPQRCPARVASEGQKGRARQVTSETFLGWITEVERPDEKRERTRLESNQRPIG